MHPHVLDASRAAHVRLHAQLVRRQRLRAASEAPNQLFDLRHKYSIIILCFDDNGLRQAEAHRQYKLAGDDFVDVTAR